MIIGQEHILNYLKRSIESNRVSHAYLFEGSGYLDKKTMALWFVKCLGCQGPDITEITVPEDKEEIGIEQIRELRRYLSLSSHSSPYKTAIIDEAERMTSEAANALLKTLEEPRGNAVLILITSIPSALPDTIVSRCEEIRFRAGSLDKISKDFIKKEYIDILEKPLNDIFKFIEKIYKNETEILNLLDNWLFWFRERMLNNSKYVKMVREIQKTKNLISATNVNKRLALENLALCIKK
jgi:DNA polymerase-3 subunit delta'